MDSKKIRALLTAASMGSLTSAAQALGYTQSGMTHMMNALEDELGVKLLLRSKSGVTLSDTGEKLLPKMQAFLAAGDALCSGAAAMQEKGLTVLRLGAYSSVARHWLPTVLTGFRAVSPDTDVQLYVGGMTDIYDMLKNDRLDCAFVSFQEALSHGLRYIPLRDDPLLAILAGDYDSGADTFPIENFSGCEFIMPADGFEMDIIPIFGKPVENVARRVQRINFDDAALVSMVEHGLGLTILSELVMQGMHSPVRCLPLDPPAYRHLGIALSERKYKDKKISRFIKCAQSTVRSFY